MLSGVTKKNKIDLADYDYRRDIVNRLLMANFTVFEVQVLEEIINGSITRKIADIADSLHVMTYAVMPMIEDLEKTGLFVISGETLIVDKEMRKYYEFQIEKFDDEFKPDMEFLQDLQRKVPIHVLPTWYSIPRTSDDIFGSLVERYLLTPRIYQRYLDELHFTDPALNGIMEDVFSSPDLKVRSSVLQEKYSLTREEFEEHMLHLEFNIVCCLVYMRVGEEWKEVVTPFYEWKSFLLHRRKSAPNTIELPVVAKRSSETAFLDDMDAVIKLIEEKTIMLEAGVPTEEAVELLAKECVHIPISSKEDVERWGGYFHEIFAKLTALRIVKKSKKKAEMCEGFGEWCAMSHAEQGRYLLKHPRNTFVTFDVDSNLFSERDQRHVERSLAAIVDKGWVYVDDFISSMEESIGTTDGVTLKKTGARWGYAIPQYTSQEYEYIKATILEKFFEAGVVMTGTCNGRHCFRVTNFGKLCSVRV